MKILIIGGSGVIGYKLVKHFTDHHNDVYHTYLANNPHLGKGYQLDITHNEDTIKLISEINPDIIIHTVALTNVDKCEIDHKLAESINVDGTNNVINACKLTKSKLVFVSTSSVFSGEKYTHSEDEEGSPISHYGVTKLRAEELVRKSNLSHLILRTDQPYCWIKEWHHTNSVIRVLTTLRNGNTLNEMTDWYNTPTYVPDFVYATERLLSDKSTGTFHLVGSDFINRYEWSLLIADIFHLEKRLIIPISSNTLNLPARRSNVRLSNEKLFAVTGIRMSGVKEGLLKMLETEHF